MTFTLKNPDAPMSYKQGIFIRNLGGGDVRGQNLTQKQASDLIAELQAKKGSSAASSSSSDDKFQQVWDAAVEAGKQAGSNVQVQPMYVTERVNVFDDNSTIKNSWKVDDGVCGFAEVRVKPANSKFANWLKKNKLARKSDVRGGLYIWISDYGQSMTRKAAHASAMAKVIGDANLENVQVWSESRMD